MIAHVCLTVYILHFSFKKKKKYSLRKAEDVYMLSHQMSFDTCVCLILNRSLISKLRLLIISLATLAWLLQSHAKEANIRQKPCLYNVFPCMFSMFYTAMMLLNQKFL